MPLGDEPDVQPRTIDCGNCKTVGSELLTSDGVRFRALMSEIDASILAGDFGQLHNLFR